MKTNELIRSTMETLIIGPNPRNGGYYSIFNVGDKAFYADICELHLIPTECMIFSYHDGKVTDWHELYCKRGLPVTEESLRQCIGEFIEQLKEE